MEKIRIDINEVMALQSRQQYINSLDIEQIQWVNGEEKIELAPRLIETFRKSRLSNTDLIDFGYFLQKEIPSFEEEGEG